MTLATVATDGALDSIWYTRCPVPTPLGIAVQRGWFRDEFAPDGIALHSLQETDDAAKRESHFDHRLVNSFRQGGNIPALWARADGRDTRVIGLSWTDEFQGILSLPGSGIATARDLRSRRLGLPKHDISIDFNRAAALKAFVTALELEGLSPRDAGFIDIPDPPATTGDDTVPQRRLFGRRWPHGYANEVGALIRGEVDAIFVKGVLGLETAHLIDAHIVAELGFHPEPLVRIGNGAPRTLTVDSGLLDSRLDIVARFLAQVVGAGEWAARHRDEAVAYIGRETQSSDEWVRYAYGEEVHEHLRTDLSETSIAGLEAFKNFLLQWGFLKQDFSVRSWIDPRPLAEMHRHARKSA